VTATDTHRAIDAVWRIESSRLIAGLARIVREFGLAEDLAQDALVAALERWPESGIPDNPDAWLMAAASRHRPAAPANVARAQGRRSHSRDRKPASEGQAGA
jgi:predicted RNA polymerase sigma factor